MTGSSAETADQPRHADLLRLLAYWQARCNGRAFPRRADIDPLDFAFMLDRVALTEIHEAPRRYRLRVVGSWWARLVGFESTGMWIEDWPHENQRRISVEAYERLIAARRPLCTRRDAWVDDRKLSYEIMHLPLSEDGARISMIMTAIGPDAPG
ncbi:MAG: PAS domain-containing protein [Rhodospirillaceae bacterium]|nr:PAS domain-containing protein [Rhodospirillaceae bacterium]